jgi:hypothetical protein
MDRKTRPALENGFFRIFIHCVVMKIGGMEHCEYRNRALGLPFAGEVWYASPYG